jgi:RHS repeat-associated protein
VTFTETPDAFGNSVASTGSTSSKYGFVAKSGYRTDGDAGLMKVGARYYDSQVGSFTTRDTFLDQKPYLYCEHDPVNFVDPSGHEANNPGLVELGDNIAAIGGIIAVGGLPEPVAPIVTPIGIIIIGIGSALHLIGYFGPGQGWYTRDFGPPSGIGSRRFFLGTPLMPQFKDA